MPHTPLGDLPLVQVTIDMNRSEIHEPVSRRPPKAAKENAIYDCRSFKLV
jgi:hypothetical protein